MLHITGPEIILVFIYFILYVCLASHVLCSRKLQPLVISEPYQPHNMACTLYNEHVMRRQRSQLVSFYDFSGGFPSDFKNKINQITTVEPPSLIQSLSPPMKTLKLYHINHILLIRWQTYTQLYYLYKYNARSWSSHPYQSVR